ncbi:hypothetical protein GCM10023191_005940 [Actinoallomurus oryzae]|uniref:Uncharacterized protein n=2 Tax=Actinoallomurus oryzae TaxID=502180 RepID=A0ABP8PC36_9ACTN
MWSKCRKTQEARLSLHMAAREWLSNTCPGAFSEAGKQQPVIDLLLLEEHDPTLGERTDRELGDALRAIGLTESATVHRSSEYLPGLLLEPVDERMCPALAGRPTWALWGQRTKVAVSAIRDISVYGLEQVNAISYMVNQIARNFFVSLAISELLRLSEERYAALRDSAKTQHGHFKGRHLARLRETFLTLSLDLTSTYRDIQHFNTSSNGEYDITFTMTEAPWITKEREAAGDTDRREIDLVKNMKEKQIESAEKLVSSDNDYRDIMSTVASLWASSDTFKIGRLALWVSLTSLLVALLVADYSGDLIVVHIWKWLVHISSHHHVK